MHTVRPHRLGPFPSTVAAEHSSMVEVGRWMIFSGACSASVPVVDDGSSPTVDFLRPARLDSHIPGSWSTVENPVDGRTSTNPKKFISDPCHENSSSIEMQ
jgi:hypothetical protein